MKKSTVIFLALIAGVSSASSFASSLPGAGLDFSAGLSQSESGSGYFVGVDWQFSDYAELSITGKSILNGDRYELTEVMTPERFQALETLAGGAGKYGPTSFSPRHNTVGVLMTLRYPIDLAGWSVAPFVDVGTQQARTKDVDIYAVSASSGSNTGTGTGSTSADKKLATVEFDSVQALVFGAGIQFGSDEHQFRVGYHSYSSNDNWSELQIMKDVAGAWLRYDYFFNDNWAFKFAFDSANQFDDPAFDVGIRYRF